MNIRLVKQKDLIELHEMIALSCRKSWSNFYPKNSIEYVICEEQNVEKLKELKENSHFYVVIENNKIIGCGAITKNGNSLTECVLRTIFVHPDFQGQGIGKVILKTLENDKYAKNAKRLELSSSIIGIPFYIKYGYEHKGGWLEYNYGQFILEKFINKMQNKPD